MCSKTKDNDFIKRQPLYDEGCNDNRIITACGEDYYLDNIPEGKRPDPTLDGVSITNGDNEDEDAVVEEWLKKLSTAV